MCYGYRFGVLNRSLAELTALFGPPVTVIADTEDPAAAIVSPAPRGIAWRLFVHVADSAIVHVASAEAVDEGAPHAVLMLRSMHANWDAEISSAEIVVHR